MTDKERILTFVLRWLGSSAWPFGPRDNTFYVDPRLEPQPGDLVICQSSGIHEATVGYFHSMEDPAWATALIRGIGEKHLTRITNESYHVVKGFEDLPQMLEGVWYKFYIKVLKAFRDGDETMYLFGGIKTNWKSGTVKNKRATITVRPHAFLSDIYKPFEVEMAFNSKTTIKEILDTLKEGGLGTAFSKNGHKPTKRNMGR